jgi:hypothetical protein
MVTIYNIDPQEEENRERFRTQERKERESLKIEDLESMDLGPILRVSVSAKKTSGINLFLLSSFGQTSIPI